MLPLFQGLTLSFVLFGRNWDAHLPNPSAVLYLLAHSPSSSETGKGKQKKLYSVDREPVGSPTPFMAWGKLSGEEQEAVRKRTEAGLAETLSWMLAVLLVLRGGRACVVSGRRLR